MKLAFRFWSSVLIACLVASGLCLRFLAVSGIPLSQSLVSRGAGCLLVVVSFARAKGLSLLPRSMGTQLLRALIAGLALTFFTLSYQWLSASAVSVLSNVDVPLLLVLGPQVGVKASPRARALAILSIFFLAWFVSGLEAQANLAYGLVSLGTGSVLLCFGYRFIQRSMTEENEAVTILVPSLAIIAYGAIQPGVLETHWTGTQACAALISGLSMFGAYYATMRLYERASLAVAEFPTLLSSIVIQPIEALLLGEPLRPSYLLSSVGFVVIIYALLNFQERGAAHA